MHVYHQAWTPPLPAPRAPQISRRDIRNAAQAIWWAISGGGSALAHPVATDLASFEVFVGCSDPLRRVLQGERPPLRALRGPRERAACHLPLQS